MNLIQIYTKMNKDPHLDRPPVSTLLVAGLGKTALMQPAKLLTAMSKVSMQDFVFVRSLKVESACYQSEQQRRKF